jgi:hypothetical protein
MKCLMLLAAVFVFSAVSGQDLPLSRVPSEVITTFKAKFPEGNIFEAKFEINHIRHRAMLDGTGQLVMFKHKIQVAALPAPVKQMLDSLYKDYKIGEAEQLNRMGVIFYQVGLEGKPHNQKLVLTGDGQINNDQLYW